MYTNDRPEQWFELFAVQLFFTLSDDMCLLLRFFDVLPEMRAATHGSHLAFNFLVGRQPVKYIGFIIDDSAGLLYACYYRGADKKDAQMRRRHVILWVIVVFFVGGQTVMYNDIGEQR
eukprot:TRINITY_DN16639_c0_g1_i1.p2 TRINITY_DN16639_c0_g1~~TRINITY_DN16639_c0_g1_i1.p2  ORF type:complete len:118 (+),score=8.28 TRINITY_DN16639_c0_g1_i1:2-355(+)